MAEHEHEFRPHVAVRTSFGATAWVDERFVSGQVDLTMQRCVTCGEQGYAIPEMPPAPKPEHDRSVGWRECPHPDCVRAAEEADRDELYGDHYPGDGCRGWETEQYSPYEDV